MIGVKHLVAFIPALVQFVLEVAVTEIVEIENAVDSHLVGALLALIEFYLLPLLVGRRIPPSRAMHEEIFR